jgi:hypothetical protein
MKVIHEFGFPIERVQRKQDECNQTGRERVPMSGEFYKKENCKQHIKYTKVFC